MFGPIGYKLVFATVVLGFVACSGTQAQSSVDERPNVLLILSDNQSASLLGAYGNTDIATPNIDRLAEEGMLFLRAFAASGVCSPTRASLLTGLMPSQTGVHNALPTSPAQIRIDEWSAIGEFRTLPQTLSAAGYYAGLIGKYHLGTHEKPQLGFDYWVTMETGHTKSFVDTTVIENGERVHIDRHITGYWTDRSIEFLEQRPADRPFFLMLSYNGPYMLPPVVTGPSQSPHADAYRANTPDFPQEPVHPFLSGWAIGAAPTDEMQAEATHAWAAIGALNNRHAMVNTAAETTAVDDGVGRVLEALETLGLEDDTLVIYTSDQGSAYGQHGLWGNTSWAYPFPAYDAHLKIPLIFRHPGRIPGNLSSRLLVSQVDIFPTVLDHVGFIDIDIERSPGRSVEPTLTKTGKQEDQPVFFEFITVRGIRTAEWKYVKRFPSGPSELYRVADDPGELVNLIDDSSYADIRNDLDARLEAHFAAVADPKYDLWNGGTGKGRLIEDYGKNHLFRDRFEGWRGPFIEQAETFYEGNE